MIIPISGLGVFSCDGGWGRHTDSGRLDHVPDGESLDGLVLGRASGAVGASNGLDVAAALLVASAVRILLDVEDPKIVRLGLLGRSLLNHDCGRVDDQ